MPIIIAVNFIVRPPHERQGILCPAVFVSIFTLRHRCQYRRCCSCAKSQTKPFNVPPSLSHIAGGVEHLTHSAIPTWQAWGVAVGLDINYVGMEMAAVVAAMNHVRKRLHRLTRFGIPAVMGFSMSLNAYEFAAGATNMFEVAAGVAMGLILPALVFLAFRVASVLADV